MTIHPAPQISDPGVSRPSREPRVLAPLSRNLIIFFLFLATVLLLQLFSGAYSSEFGAYPDEPAHYVTSLMVREYITGPSPIWPMKFAENYYAHYPKVAFGHWPPLFYFVQGLWMILFSATRTSVRLELAFTTAALAFSLFWEAKRWFGEVTGVLAGLLVVCLPLVQASADQEMAEMLLALTCFWSAIYFARYLDSERLSDSMWFAVFFSLAVLTKGSAWLLVFIPPIALVLTKKLYLLLHRSFWFAIGLIALCCLPWQLLTFQVAARGWTGGTQPSLQYTSSALLQFGRIFIFIAGPVLAAVAAFGIVITVIVAFFRTRRVASGPAVMLALLLGDWVFHSVVPAGVEDRKLIMAVPALILFLFAGGNWIANRLPLRGELHEYRAHLVAAVLAIVFFAQVFTVPRQMRFGYREAAQFITSDPALRGATILASSESAGEGLLISEIAMREPRPRDTIIRGTKALANVDWTGTEYRSLFSTSQQVLQFIQESHIGVVVTDNYPPLANFAHTRLLLDTIKQNPGRFRLLRTFQGNAPAGHISVFQVVS